MLHKKKLLSMGLVRGLRHGLLSGLRGSPGTLNEYERFWNAQHLHLYFCVCMLILAVTTNAMVQEQSELRKQVTVLMGDHRESPTAQLVLWPWISSLRLLYARQKLLVQPLLNCVECGTLKHVELISQKTKSNMDS